MSNPDATTATIEELRAAWNFRRPGGLTEEDREIKDAAEQALIRRLQPTTLTVFTRYGAESVEVEFKDGGRDSVVTGFEFAILAGRTATKTRLGALRFSRFYGPRERFGRVADEIWAEDENGNLYGFNGTHTSGNKGQYGTRVVGHVSNHEITAKV